MNTSYPIDRNSLLDRLLPTAEHRHSPPPLNPIIQKPPYHTPPANVPQVAAPCPILAPLKQSGFMIAQICHGGGGNFL